MKPLLLMMVMAGPALAASEIDGPGLPAIGSMEVVLARPATSEPAPPRRQNLELASLDVTVETHGDVAQTRVLHDFYNQSNERLEGTFRFPLPAGAEITDLSMEVDGRMVDGELIERRKAERIFNDTVDEMRDPALLTWEAGNVFVLRVFPIEPTSHKRVVIRYLTPLKENGRSGQYVYQAEAAQLAAHVGHFRFTLDGKTLHDEAKFEPRNISVEIPEDAIFNRSLREIVGGTNYLRVKLPVAAGGPMQPRGHFRWVLVVDVSRSALEARPLTLDTVRAALSSLPAGDQFVLMACDIQCRQSATAFSAATPAATTEALRFLSTIDFDGATDLGAALTLAARRAGRNGGQVLYIGDGNPTWGVTDEAELSQSLGPAFADVPLHAVVLGKYARPALLTQLSNRAGGLLVTPARKTDLDAFARALAEFGRVGRIYDISLSVAEGSTVTPIRPASLGAGEALTAFVRSEHAMPATIHLRAKLNGQLVERDIPLPRAVATVDVARRFAGSRIRELELEGGHDEEVLALSLQHRVLSTKTAWLVLENDEAYRKNQIERHEKQKSADPTISGKDLTSTDARVASASPGADGNDGNVGGEGPEPELWLVAGLLLIAFGIRRKLGVVR